MLLERTEADNIVDNVVEEEGLRNKCRVGIMPNSDVTRARDGVNNRFYFTHTAKVSKMKYMNELCEPR